MTAYKQMSVLSDTPNEEVLEMMGFHNEQYKYNSLSGKVIVDYGSGVSGFLESLGITNMAELYELDPVYENQELFQDMLEGCKVGMESIIEETPLCEKWLNHYKGCLKRITNASYSGSQGIKRVIDIKYIDRDIDIVIITCLFSVIDNPIEFLMEMKENLSNQGEVYITEPNDMGTLFCSLLLILKGIDGVLIKENGRNSMIQIKKDAINQVIPIVESLCDKKPHTFEW